MSYAFDDDSKLLEYIASTQGQIAEILGDKAVEAFAKGNGWKISRPFGLDSLRLQTYTRKNPYLTGRLFDSPLWFTKRGKPVAIVGQPRYDGEELLWDGNHWSFSDLVHDILRLVGDRKLEIFAPPAPLASICGPGTNRFLVFARHGENVRWLPEQRDIYGAFSTPGATGKEEIAAVRNFDGGETDVLNDGTSIGWALSLHVVKTLRGDSSRGDEVDECPEELFRRCFRCSGPLGSRR